MSGAPYGIRLPDACAEATVPFVEYLNWVFRSAGFPHYTGGGTKEWEVTYNRGRELLRL